MTFSYRTTLWVVFLCLFFNNEFNRRTPLQNDFLYGFAGISQDKDSNDIQLESLILAQSERWRRGLGMQVERYRKV